MRITTILGTTRPGNFTGKVLAIVNEELDQRGVQVDFIDAAALDLTFPGTGDNPGGNPGLQASVAAADAIIFATPEYHGGYSAMTKLLIENLGFPSALSGKTIGLLGVAAGRIGAVKALEQLRTVLSHVGAVVLPQAVSVASVQAAFDADGQLKDPQLDALVRGLAASVVQFAGHHPALDVAS